jgi:hypothetical protein
MKRHKANSTARSSGPSRAAPARTATLPANKDRTRRGGLGAGGIALEEGVWGRNLLKVSPQLARHHQT